MADVFRWSGAGLASGNLTTSSAGSGDTAPTAISGTTPTIVAGSPTAINFLGSPTSTQSTAYWDIATQTQAGYRFYWTAPSAAPASSTFPIIFQVNSGTTMLAYIDITSTKRFNLRGTAGVLQQSPTDTWVPGNRYRIEVTVTHSTGAIAVRIFADEATSHLVELNGTSTLGANHSRVYFGKVNGIALDAVGVSHILGTDQAQFPGRYSVVANPTVFRWNGTTYVPLKGLRWDGTAYQDVTQA